MSPVALVVLGLALAGLLVSLLPDHGAMQERIAEREVDKLSLIYLELAVYEHPEDMTLRLLLARRYYELSRYDDAEETLAPLLEQGSPTGRQARLLGVEVRHARCAALVRQGNPRAETCREELLADVRAWLASNPPLTPAMMARLAQIGVAGGDGELASDIYTLLAENAVDPEERQTWQHKAVAATAKPDLAAEIGRKLLSLRPNDPVMIAQQIEAELAIGEVRRALDLSQRLVAVDPANRRAHERLATVADWAGEPLLAMDQWAWLARHGGEARHLERAMTLARSNWDQALLLELSWMAARRRGMGLQDVLELANLYVRLGDPETARSLLARQLAAHPDHEPTWRALLEVQRATADLSAAVRTWAQIQARFGISEGERREYAVMLWRARRPDEALAVMLDGPQQEPATVRLTAELAWRTERLDPALDAHAALWRSGEARPDEIQRLLLLARHQDDADLLMEVALDRWHRQQDPQALLTAMAMAADGARWRDLDRMLDEADDNPGPLEAEPHYWRLRMLRGHRRLRAALHDEDLARANQVLRALDGDLVRAADRSQRFARHPDYRTLRADVHRQQLYVALQRDDRATIRRVLAAAGDDIPDEDRVEALTVLGEHAKAARLAVRARRRARNRSRRDRLGSQAESLATRVPRHAEGHTRLLEMGGLRLFEAGGSFRFSWDDVGIGGRLDGRRLQPRAGQDMGLTATSEAEVMALAEWRTDAARTEVGLGAHVRGSSAAPQLTLGHERRVGQSLRASADLGVGLLTEEHPLLRSLGVRDHLSVRAAMDLDARLFAGARLAGIRYRLGGVGPVAAGVDIEGSVGYRLLRGPRAWNVRLIGLFAPRHIDATLWPGYQAGGPGGSARGLTYGSLFDTSIGGATKLSVATTLSEGWPGTAPSPVGGLRYFAELAGGWLVATDTVDLAFALGLGVPVFGGDELSLSASLAGAMGSLAQEPRQSIVLRYARSLWQ